MHPNLVGAAGFEAAQEQAGDWLSWPRASPCPRARPVRRAVAFEHFPVGYCLAPALAHCHAVARLRVAVDRPVDGAARPIRRSPDEGEIGALERLAAAAMVGELCRERAVRAVALRYDHEAGRILVEPMHDAGTPLAADAGQALAAMGDERIDERPGPIAGGGMYDEVLGLVDDDDVGVFVDHIQRDGLGR